MDRKAGYLANIFNVPPLIFRFQFNPETLTEKKSFQYEAANGFGQWSFDQTRAGATSSGISGALGGLVKDAKEIGSLLIATKPLEPKGGEPRQFSLDFVLDASRPGPLDGDSHYGGSIEPDLAILRSFMNPAWDPIDVGKMLLSGFKNVPCWNRPPECSLVYGGLSVTCVMTDLSIKITEFQQDRSPLRAEVSVTLKEQPFSFTPLIELVTRNFNVAKSYDRPGFWRDVLAVTPVVNLFE